MSNEIAVRAEVVQSFALSDMQVMADAAVKSQLFGVKTKEQALALMLLCNAEGIHPMRAVQEYHIIQGKPSLTAQAMQGRFQRMGGKIQWIERSLTACEAEFFHPQGGTVKIKYTMEDAKRAQLDKKDNWVKNPRQMLAARVVSEGVRAVFPGVLGGMYTPEEVSDFAPEPTISAPVAKLVNPIAPEIIEKINGCKTVESLSKYCGAQKTKIEAGQMPLLLAEYNRREAELLSEKEQPKNETAAA